MRWSEEDAPLSKEEAITLRLKLVLTSPPVTIPKFVNSAVVNETAFTEPEPKSNVVEVPTSC